MVREILFQGKTTETEEWVTGYYMQRKPFFEIGHYIKSGNYLYKVYPESVGQFTGIEDKEKEKIFENDIVESKNTIFKVEYNTQQARFWLSPLKSKVKEDYIIMLCDNQGLGNGSYKREDLNKIGNIIDNKELLKEQ